MPGHSGPQGGGGLLPTESPALRTKGLVGVELAETVPSDRTRGSAGGRAPGSGWGRVWPRRIPEDRVTGAGAGPSPPAPLPPSPGAGTAVTSLLQCRCSSGLPVRAQSQTSGSLQSHKTILQARKLMRCQPPSAPGRHRAEPALPPAALLTVPRDCDIPRLPEEPLSPIYVD